MLTVIFRICFSFGIGAALSTAVAMSFPLLVTVDKNEALLLNQMFIDDTPWWIVVGQHQSAGSIIRSVALIIKKVDPNDDALQIINQIYAVYPDFSEVTVATTPAWSRLGHLPPSHQERITDEQGRGWPFIAMWSDLGPMQPAYGLAVDKPPSPGLPVNDRVIPRQIVWRGILLNTASFGLAVFAAWLSGIAIRAKYRIMKHQCPQCAYQLHARQCGCSECGWQHSVS